eukprot:4014173-Ditylum_brightwellii.AAC.1
MKNDVHDFDEMKAGTSNNIEDDDTGYIDDDNDDCPEEADDQMPSSPQPAVNLGNSPSIVESMKASILYNVSDVSQDVHTGSTLQSMSDAVRYAKLDKNNIRHSRSFALHSYYLDGITGQLSSGYKEVTKIIIDHGARRNLFFFLSGA